MAILARASCTLSTVRDVASTTRYYKLQSSTASKPAKPTTNLPSGWTTTEPSYTEGSTNSLYFTDLTVFTDGDFAYSDVSLSSSYEAAKQAYNKAVAAGTAANNAMTAANGKNKVFHQATAPATSAGLTAGDIWFDTSNDYKMSRWTGSAWTEEQFGESAIADASIGNAKIKDASIEHAKIKSLDMGKAAVGKLKAQYLDVDDVFAQDITATGTITGATLSGGSLVISGYYGSDIVAVSEGGVKLSREIVWYDDNDEDHIEVRPLAALEWPGDAANVGLVLYTGDANDNPSTAFFAGGTIVFEQDFGHVADNNPANNVVMSKSGIYRISEESGGYKASPILDFGWRSPVMQRGTTSLVSAPANGYKDVSVTFPKAFSGNPTVLCSLQGNAANGKYGCLSCSPVRSSIGTTGCILRLYNADSSAHDEYISWIAVY